MISDRENGVIVDVWTGEAAHAEIDTNHYSTGLNAEEVKQVADMLYVVAEKMEQND